VKTVYTLLWLCTEHQLVAFRFTMHNVTRLFVLVYF